MRPSITLCAVVKNEAQTMRSCLAKTFKFFDEIEITDTGSDDETVNILREEYEIEPSYYPVYPSNSFSILEARNYNIGLAKTDYICVLDGDEVLSERDVIRMRETIESTKKQTGYFLHWITHTAEQVIHDYKLHLFKRHPMIRFQGARHPNVTRSIRDLGGQATQCNAVIQHFPEHRKRKDKQKRYIKHLSELIKMEPKNYRYKWFLGMTLYSCKQNNEALPYLQDCANSKSYIYPVECLNSHMLLAAIIYSSGQAKEASRIITRALHFHTKVAKDFEVQINKRLIPTLLSMHHDIECEKKELHPYSFGR